MRVPTWPSREGTPFPSTLMDWACSEHALAARGAEVNPKQKLGHLVLFWSDGRGGRLVDSRTTSSGWKIT